MNFIRIPSFLKKGLANLFIVDTTMLSFSDTSFGSVSLSSAAASLQHKEIEERAKATLNDKTKMSLTTVVGRLLSEAFKTSMSSVSVSVDAPAKHSLSRSTRLECAKQFHGDKDPKRHYSGHLCAFHFFQ
jgi:hypothetical protein